MGTRIEQDEVVVREGAGQTTDGTEHGLERLLELSADILATFSTSTEIVPACDAISAKLRDYFGACHVALGLVNIPRRSREILGFSSSVLERESLERELPDEDILAYGRAIDGETQCFTDLGDGPLNPGTDLARQAGIRSLIRAPFNLSDGSVGLVSIGSGQRGQFNEGDAHDLQELCRPMGIAIDRVRLQMESVRARSIMEAQARVLGALGPGATMQGVAEVFVAEARWVFEASHGLVALAPPVGPIEIIALSSEQMVPADFDGQSLEDPLLRTAYAAVLRGESEMVELAPNRYGQIAQRSFESGLRQLLRVPIVSDDGGVRGVVTVGSPKTGQWRQSDLQAFQQLSGVLGLVMERCELLAMAQERHEKTAALTRILATLNVNASPFEVAPLIARELRALIGADAVMIHSWDLASQMRTRLASDGTDSWSSEPVRASLSQSRTYLGLIEQGTAHFDSTAPDAAPEWLRGYTERTGMRSSVAVRLDGSAGPVGMIAAAFSRPGTWGREAMPVLEAIAPPLAMLLERASIVTSLREHSEQAQDVLNILSAMGPRETFTEVAGPIASAIRAMYGADHCAIGTRSGDLLTLAGLDTAYELPWAVGDSTQDGMPEPLPESASGVAHVHSDLLDPGLELGRTLMGLRARGARSTMRVLLGPPEAPIGAITVGSSTAGRYTEADARRLAAIAQPLGVAAAYFHGKQEAEARAARIESMNRVLTRLGSGGTPEHLAAGFLAECRTLLDCELGAVLQFNGDNAALRTLAADGDLAHALPDSEDFPMLTGVSPLLIDDLTDFAPQGALTQLLCAEGFVSGMRVPLVVRERQMGTVTMWARNRGRFSHEDMDTLVTLTRPLALALERATALQSLAESELKYRSLVAQAEEMIFLVDGSTLEILEANEYTERALGYNRGELLGITVDHLVEADPDDVRTNVHTTIQQGELHIADRLYKRKDGSLLHVDVVTSLVTYGGRQAVLALVRDVSERKSMQAQLIQGQKMESLGLMAGNLAHDFNNLLTTILGFAGLLKRSQNMDADERENLGLIEDAARRAADLTGRLLAFARGGLVRFGPVDLRAVVDDTLHLARPSLHNNLEVALTLPAGPVKVEGDASQIEQALLNIILNAKDAMPEGGRISVALSVDESVATVTVTDTGPGMTEETRTRIFEPFYTTKPIGSGTGLGMAITYGIIQGHHGDVAVETRLGAGTTFTITLPLLEHMPVESDAIYSPGDGNLILVVDDDEMVRRTTSATLAELGFNVVEAPGGATAVQVVKARPDRIAAVLLDLVMPGMTGSETFRALTAVRPDLPVIVCTGYAADAHIDTDVKRRIAGLVQKPFTAERLARALADAGVTPVRR